MIFYSNDLDLSPAFPNFKLTLGHLECRSSSKAKNFRAFLLSLLRRRPMLRTTNSSCHSPRVTWPRWSWPGTSSLGKREPWLSASRKYPWSQNPKGFESSQHVLKYLRWSRLRKHYFTEYASGREVWLPSDSWHMKGKKALSKLH